ncbi:MAG: hypothetical protein QOI98_831 [Solirubrobacteraceae bacterium]|nr:hypothetical protein [Solirubrobacteraceae bacterium]
MEAATPLPLTYARIRGNRLEVDGLSVDDDTTVRLAREREEAGEDVVKLVVDAIAIGARVLDREQTGANADFVKAEFERAARELDGEFTDRARQIAERLDAKVDEAFGEENGHVTKALARHFGDESSVAVQNRVKAVLTEVSVQMREDLRTQFSSDSESNPLATFQRATLAILKQNADQQAEQMRAMTEKLEANTLELTELRGDREKQIELSAAEERGTAKGRTYEEAVAETLDAIATARGDDCDAVGDVRGTGGKVGDVVVSIDACAGPARGRMVFEAKNSKLSKNQALAELDSALAGRDADYAVLVVRAEDKLPARMHPLREYGGNKLLVTYDPDEGRLALEVAYGLARARVLMARSDGEGVDTAALAIEVERAVGAMEDVRRIKSQLTNASTGIEEARRILESMAAGVRAHLAQIEVLLASAGEPDDD